MLAVASNGGIEVLVAAMSGHTPNDENLSNVCGALSQVSAKPENRDHIAGNGGIVLR